jgi:hypothetical protein
VIFLEFSFDMSYKFYFLILIFYVCCFRIAFHNTSPLKLLRLETMGSVSLLEVTMAERDKKRRFLYGEKRYRILFLSEILTYNILIDRHHFDFYRAALRHSWVETALWGPGFDGYNDSATVQENILNRYGSLQYWDILNVWPAISLKGSQELVQNTVVAYREHECWHKMCESWADGLGAHIYMLTFPYEILQFYSNPSRRLWLHTPTAIDGVRLFGTHEERTSPRVHTVTVIGAVGCDPPIYPLRAQVTRLILEGRIPGGHVHKHPGYHHRDKDAAWHERQQIEYANVIRSSQIVIGDSSVFKYGLQKLAEIPAAGALLVTDMPLEREPVFQQFVVEVCGGTEKNCSDETLLTQLSYWLSHSAEREERAQRGQLLALQHFTYDDNVDSLIAAAQDVKRGRFGLKFTHPFTVGCAATGRVTQYACEYGSFFCH